MPSYFSAVTAVPYGNIAAGGSAITWDVGNSGGDDANIQIKPADHTVIEVNEGGVFAAVLEAAPVAFTSLVGRLRYGATTRDQFPNSGPAIGDNAFLAEYPVLSAGQIEFRSLKGVDIISLSATADLPWTILAGVTSPQVINMSFFSLTLFRLGPAA